MKKISKLLCVFLVALMVLVPTFSVSAKKTTTTTTTTTTTNGYYYTYEKSSDENAINVYVFYQATCTHCKDLHEYLQELKGDDEVKNKFNVVDYEVSNSTENNTFMYEVAEYFDYNLNGVPFFVIGDEYWSGFPSDASSSTLKQDIIDAYNDSNYTDVVGKLADGSLSENNSKMGSNIVGIIILAITVVVIIVLIVLSSRNTYYDEEEIVEEEKEEKVVKKATSTKEDDSKKASNKSTATKSKAKTSNSTKKKN